MKTAFLVCALAFWAGSWTIAPGLARAEALSGPQARTAGLAGAGSGSSDGAAAGDVTGFALAAAAPARRLVVDRDGLADAGAAFGPLAQRTITREWGLSDDSTYVTLDVPGLKSEALAAILSSAAPGAGQLYVGESSGWWFALAEVASWTGWVVFHHGAENLRQEAADVAGSPADPAAAWSFDRWATATQSDPTQLQALYTADPESFYRALVDDPSLQSGWSSATVRDQFAQLRERADHRTGGERYAATALWVNHLVASVDAIRAARINNFPLRQNLHVRMNGRLSHGRPGFAVAIERSFK